MAEYNVRFARGFSLYDALSMLDEDDEELHNVEEITIFPLVNACGNITDKDSGDEQSIKIDNLPGSQLSASVKIKIACPTERNKENFSLENNLLWSNFSKSKKETKTQKKKVYQRPGDVKQGKFVEPDLGFQLRTPLDYFYDFVDDSIINTIVYEKNRYAQQRNRTETVTDTDIRAFVGVLILSGYIPIPRWRMLWKRERDSHNELVAKAITRDKFDYIMANIHIRDNNGSDQEDKFAKVRPLFQHLNRKFMEHGRLEEMHYVNEAMVPYYGRHGTKQFMKGKPLRYGYKLRVGSSRLGYVYWFEPYQGLSINISTTYGNYGVRAAVVLKYTDALRRKWANEKFYLFLDNFFTSINQSMQSIPIGVPGFAQQKVGTYLEQ